MRFLSAREIDEGSEMAFMYNAIVGYSMIDDKSQKIVMLI